jgi:hypothetical protein
VAHRRAFARQDSRATAQETEPLLGPDSGEWLQQGGQAEIRWLPATQDRLDDVRREQR